MKVPIIIDFERAGGYAGLTLHVSVDSHSLPANEAEELDRLINEAGIHELSQESFLPESFPDQFLYRINIKRGDERLSIQLTEKQIPPALRPLLKFLTRRSRFKK
jgi:hypothetical protein